VIFYTFLAHKMEINYTYFTLIQIFRELKEDVDKLSSVKEKILRYALHIYDIKK